MLAYSFYESDFRIRRYAEALVGISERVDIITLRREGEKRYELLKGVNIARIGSKKANEKRISSHIIRNTLFFLKSSVILILKYLKYNYEIIHIHNPPDFLVFAAWIPKLLGSRIILDMHENLPEFYCTKFNRGSKTFTFKLLLWLEKVSTNFADRVIAAHDLLKERIVWRDKISDKKCTALLNYPNLKYFQYPPNKSDGDLLRIIYPGTVSYLHGLDIAVKALGIVKKELPNLKFDIYTEVRNDGYYRSLIELVKDLDLGGNVKLWRLVPNETIGKILNGATMGIIPKRSGVFGSEAFSTKILEFMAAGIPVIASRTKIDEYYFDSSMVLFFEPENYIDLARCILELYRNEEKRETLARMGREFVKKNNWEIKRQAYLDIVSGLVREKKQGNRIGRSL